MEWPTVLILLSLLILVSCAPPNADLDDATTAIRFVDAAHEDGTAVAGTVTVSGLPTNVARDLRDASPSTAAWRSCFAVHTVRDDGALGQPSVVGRYDVVAGVIRFVPRFPPPGSMTFRARVDRACLSRLVHATEVASEEPSWIEMTWTSPASGADAPRVVAVYPSSTELPANLLKLYIHFSAPMARGDAYDHIRLIDVETETRVEAPFLALGEELWDDQQQRFTLFFDPGRIKRGLRPHKEAGPPLEEGRRYRLEIASTWTSAAGLSLDESHVKGFMVVSDDRTAPSVDDWSITAPLAGSREPIEVSFPEPLDQALLSRVVHVRYTGGQRVSGVVSIGDDETAWRLVPDVPWAEGAYRLEVEAILEDLAGNNLNAVFDREVATQATSSDATIVTIPFVVVAKPTSNF